MKRYEDVEPRLFVLATLERPTCKAIIIITLPYISMFFLFAGAICIVKDWRNAFVYASVIWGVLVIFFVEGLSVFNLVRPIPMMVCWSVACLLPMMFVLYAIFVYRRQFEALWNSLGEMLKSRATPTLSIIILFLLITLAIAIVAPPNNWDSATYHMSRVMHWLKNGSVAHYPAHTAVQLWLNSWAEFAILNFQTLGRGSDLLANTIQWFAFLGCMISSSLIVRHLGGSSAAQYLVALIVATTPTVILQSTSTQNDLVCAFWMANVALFSMRVVDVPNVRNSIFFGLSLGLAVATKGTSYFFAVSFVMLALLCLTKKQGVSRILRTTILIIILISVLNLNHWYRNYKVWNNPLGDPVLTSMVKNDVFGFDVTFSNIIRNVSLEIGTPIQKVNRISDYVVKKLHGYLRLDVNDPRTTYGRYFISKLSNHEDSAGNILLFIMFFVSMIWLLSKSGKWKEKYSLSLFIICMIMGIVLYCAMMKYHEWAARFHTTFFVLAAVPVGIMLAERRKIAFYSTVLFTVAAMPWLLMNQTRPLLWEPKRGWNGIFNTPRVEQYFANYPHLYGYYKDVVENISNIKNCSTVGLKENDGSIEYPLWQLAREHKLDLNFKHIEVENASKYLESGYGRDEDVCAVIALEQDDNWHPKVMIDDSIKRYNIAEGIVLFVPN